MKIERYTHNIHNVVRNSPLDIHKYLFGCISLRLSTYHDKCLKLNQKLTYYNLFQVITGCRFQIIRLIHSGSVSSNRTSPVVDSIIRVDHAGELGADRIYAGQMAVLGNNVLHAPTLKLDLNILILQVIPK